MMMKRVRLYRNLRSAVILGPLILFVLAFLAGAAFLAWANHTGMPISLRTKFEDAISENGTHLRIGGLHYSPLRGITAKHLTIFRDAARTDPIAQIETAQLDIDHLELSRGRVHILRASLNKAQVTLPVNPNDPKEGNIIIQQLEGEIHFSNQLQRHFSNVRGIVANIPIEVDGEILWYRPDSPPAPATAEGHLVQFRKIHALIQQLQTIHFPDETPPLLKIEIQGDLNNTKTMRAQAKFFAPALQFRKAALFNTQIHAAWSPDSLDLSLIKSQDHHGKLNARAHFSSTDHQGTFQISSSLSLTPILDEFPKLASQTQPYGNTDIHASGTVKQQGEQWQINTIGEAKLRDIRVKNILFDNIQTSFSWQNGDLYLSDLSITQQGKQATGRFLLSKKIVRFQLDSTLPLPTYRAFIKDIPLEHVINDFHDVPNTKIHTILTGRINLNDLHDWETKGNVEMHNSAYRGAPFHFAQCRLDLSHKALRFLDGQADIDYSSSPLTQKMNGIVPKSHAELKEVCYDSLEKTIKIVDFHGNLWPSSALETFAPSIAKIVEQYRFYAPPEVRADGKVWLFDHEKNHLDIAFSSNQPAETDLLGAALKVSNAKGTVTIDGEQTNVVLSTQEFENLHILDNPTSGKSVNATVLVKNQDIRVQFSSETLNDVFLNQNKSNAQNVTGNLHISPNQEVDLSFHADAVQRLSLYKNLCDAVDITGKLHVRDKQSNLAFHAQSLENFSFLTKKIPIHDLTGTAQISQSAIDLPDVKFKTLGGNATLKMRIPTSPQQRTSGEIVWNDLQLPSIAKTYEFHSQSGSLSGRIEFSQLLDQLETLDAKGLVSLENAELFSVPIFGPLSPLIASTLSNRKAGWSIADKAFCNFDIKEGQLRTNDFYTSASSLVFTGDAQIDLLQKTILMTIRMNAKGFLGIITLPLRPFYGLFQFRGQGPITKPDWHNVIFTSPPKTESDRLLTPPKAVQIPD